MQQKGKGKGAVPKALRFARSSGDESRRENDRQQARMHWRSRSPAPVHDFRMPVLPATLPRGVRIIDARGGYAVALSCAGVFLGIYLRSGV